MSTNIGCWITPQYSPGTLHRYHLSFLLHLHQTALFRYNLHTIEFIQGVELMSFAGRAKSHLLLAKLLLRGSCLESPSELLLHKSPCYCHITPSNYQVADSMRNDFRPKGEIIRKFCPGGKRVITSTDHFFWENLNLRHRELKTQRLNHNTQGITDCMRSCYHTNGENTASLLGGINERFLSLDLRDHSNPTPRRSERALTGNWRARFASVHGSQCCDRSPKTS